jgi:hypothetical protein
MKYRVRERTQGGGTKLYDVQWKHGDFFSFLNHWSTRYVATGLDIVILQRDNNKDGKPIAPGIRKD